MHRTTTPNHLVAAGLARWYRGRLIPIIQGGDGRDEPLFPTLPDDLTSLSDETLADLSTQFQTIAASIAAGDEDTLGDLRAEQIVPQVEAGEAAFAQITAEQDARAEAAQNYDARVAEMASRFGVDPSGSFSADGDGDDAADTDTDAGDDDDTDDDDTADGDGDGDGDGAATASARPRNFRRPLPAAGRHKPTGAMGANGQAHLVTQQGLQNFPAGEEVDSKTFARILSDIAKFGRLMPGQKVVVASAAYPFPDERRLDIKNLSGNISKINAVNGDDALVASGGLCNPLEPIYDIPGVESADRPVRDALASFQADRGGVQVPANFVITDYSDAVDVVDAADDELGGTFAVKSAMRIECPSFSEVVVDSIYRMIEVGNLTARAYPELLERIDTLVRANHARRAEQVLLDAIKAGSTAVTGPDVSGAGAVWELLGQIVAGATGMRSRHRMRPEIQIRALLPFWIVDLLQLDLSRGAFDRFHGRQEIVGYLQQYGVQPAFYLDTPTTGTSQIFAAQTGGNMLAFPISLQWGLYPEGSWLHLDAGQLDLGIVRDSTLNSTNDYQVFAETWEQAAFVGVESQWVTSANICPNGTVSLGKDLSAICTFS